MHSGARVAITGSTFQASQPWINRSVVLCMLVASWEDILGSDGSKVIDSKIFNRVIDSEIFNRVIELCSVTGRSTDKF